VDYFPSFIQNLIKLDPEIILRIWDYWIFYLGDLVQGIDKSIGDHGKPNAITVVIT